MLTLIILAIVFVVLIISAVALAKAESKNEANTLEDSDEVDE